MAVKQFARAHSHRPRTGIHPELRKRTAIGMNDNSSTQFGKNRLVLTYPQCVSCSEQTHGPSILSLRLMWT